MDKSIQRVLNLLMHEVKDEEIPHDSVELLTLYSKEINSIINEAGVLFPQDMPSSLMPKLMSIAVSAVVAMSGLLNEAGAIADDDGEEPEDTRRYKVTPMLDDGCDSTTEEFDSLDEARARVAEMDSEGIYSSETLPNGSTYHIFYPRDRVLRYMIESIEE